MSDAPDTISSSEHFQQKHSMGGSALAALPLSGTSMSPAAYSSTEHQTKTGRRGYLWSSPHFAKFYANLSSLFAPILAHLLHNPIFTGTSEETYLHPDGEGCFFTRFPWLPGTRQCWDFQGGQILVTQLADMIFDP